MQIGHLATRTGTTTATIRYYEAEGVLPPPHRSPNGYRHYDETAVERVAFVRRAQSIGLSLREIHEILGIRDGGDAPCVHVTHLLHTHLADVETRLVDLQRHRDELEGLLADAERLDPRDCGGVCEIIESPRTRRET